jgi:hypothetical protein
LFPSNWRKGINAVKRARKHIRNDIFQWLSDKGLTAFEAEKILSELPIIFAFKNENKDIALWCFVIEEKERRFDNVLAVSVVAGKKKVIDGFFLFPVQNFTRTNFLILSQNNSLYHSSVIKSSNIEKIITQLISDMASYPNVTIMPPNFKTN